MDDFGNVENGTNGSDYDDSVMDEDEIFESDSGDDDKWERVYEGRFWVPKPDGSVTLRQWDMFTDKAYFLDVVRDYMVQEGIYMRYLKNEPTNTLESVRERVMIGGYRPLLCLMVSHSK